MDSYVRSNTVARRLRRISLRQKREEALGFIDQFALETELDDASRDSRKRDIARALAVEGHYTHTPDELEFGAKVAWRNHARCIGRLAWKTLRVHDRRDAEDVGDILDLTLEGMEASFRGGNLGASISIFSPAKPGAMPPTFISAQILQYAGYLQPDGSVIGDRQNIEITERARSLGWKRPGEPSHFDLLPVLMRDAKGRQHAFSIDPGLAHQVSITHPQYPDLAELALRWYGIPCVADMILTIGGIDYPCAPFSGYYMGTEIASRNLTDERRYDFSERIARAFGFDPEGSSPLWRDRMLTELNHAVLDSFGREGIKITDHHTASRHYMEFAQQERRAGRIPSGEWSWIVPPQAGSACPVFHLPMDNLHAIPNFYASRHADGGDLYLDRSLFRESHAYKRYSRWKRRYRDWRRTRDRLWHRV